MPPALERAGALNTITFTEVEAHDAHDPRADREHGGLRRNITAGWRPAYTMRWISSSKSRFASLSTRRSFGRLTEHLQALA